MLQTQILFYFLKPPVLFDWGMGPRGGKGSRVLVNVDHVLHGGHLFCKHQHAIVIASLGTPADMPMYGLHPCVQDTVLRLACSGHLVVNA